MNRLPNYTDQALLLELAAGNEHAFRQLFNDYHGRLYSYIFRLIKSKQVAEELVMDVFMKIWMGRDLAGNIQNFDAFLFRIAHNKSIDFLRSAANDHRLRDIVWEGIELSAAEGADTNLLQQEFQAKLQEAILQLPPQKKKIYQLSREQGLTHQQIANQVKLSKATVNNHIVEAQSFIRNYLSAGVDLTILILMLQHL